MFRNINPNTFGVTPSYDSVDKKQPNILIQKLNHKTSNEKLYNLSGCQLENECTFEKRRQTKHNYSLNYNSILKVGESYFNRRGLSHDAQNLVQIGKKYKLIKENVGERGKKGYKGKNTTTVASTVNGEYQEQFQGRLSKINSPKVQGGIINL